MCRCGGAESGRNASTGTSRLSSARMWRASACASGVSEGCTCAAKASANSSSGPSLWRRRCGIDFASARTFSLSSPGTSHSQRAARHLVEQRHRHRHGHAVARRARLEVVVEPERVRAEPELVREVVGGDARRLVAHQVFALQVQELRRLRARRPCAMPRNRRRCGCLRECARRRTRGSARRPPGCRGGATCAPGARSPRAGAGCARRTARACRTPLPPAPCE